MAERQIGDDRVRLADDVDDFYALVAPHVGKMGRLAARRAGAQERDDIVQEALLLAWRSRRQFDPQRGSLSGWLLTITAHETSRLQRRLRRLFAGPVADAVDLAAFDRDIDLDQALNSLTRRERMAIDCFYFADLSVAETAAVMGCSEGTVKSTLASGRRRLRQILE